MESAMTAVSGKRLWTGRVLSALPVLYLLLVGGTRVVQVQGVMDWFASLGYPARLAVPTAILELACTALYVIPQTAVLGAILLTGYLGGAVASNVRIGGDWFHILLPVLIGALVWGGLYLRDARLEALVPLRRSGR